MAGSGGPFTRADLFATATARALAWHLAGARLVVRRVYATQTGTVPGARAQGDIHTDAKEVGAVIFLGDLERSADGGGAAAVFRRDEGRRGGHTTYWNASHLEVKAFAARARLLEAAGAELHALAAAGDAAAGAGGASPCGLRRQQYKDDDGGGTAPGVWAWACDPGAPSSRDNGPLPWAAIAPAPRRVSFHDGLLPHAVGPTAVGHEGSSPRFVVAVKMVEVEWADG